MTVKICPMYMTMDMGSYWYYYALHWTDGPPPQGCYGPCPFLARPNLTPPPTNCANCAGSVAGCETQASPAVVVCEELKKKGLDYYPHPKTGLNPVASDPDVDVILDVAVNDEVKFVKHTPKAPGAGVPPFVARVMYVTTFKPKDRSRAPTPDFGVGHEISPAASGGLPTTEVKSVTLDGKVATVTVDTTKGERTYYIVLHK